MKSEEFIGDACNIEVVLKKFSQLWTDINFK